jgi:hypothetical protein
MGAIKGLDPTYFIGGEGVTTNTWLNGEIRDVTVVIGRNLDYTVPTGE